jgi:hypothetical protein
LLTQARHELRTLVAHDMRERRFAKDTAKS